MPIQHTYTEKVKNVFSLRKGEGWIVSLLMLYSFFQTVALALFFTAASAIFITQYPVSSLPYVYISACVVLLGMGFIYTKLSAYFPPRQLILAEVCILFVSILLFRLGFMYAQVAWMAFGLIVWHRVMSSYLSAGFIRLALILFDVRQSKRLLGLISSTEIPASVLGYLLASLLVPFMGTVNLLWVSAIGLLLALVFLTLIVTKRQDFDVPEPEVEIASPVEAEPKNWVRRRFKSRLILSLSVTCFAAAITFILIEFAFLSQVHTKFSNQADIAYFLGIILGSGQLAAFFIKTFFYSYLQRRFGIQIALYTLPVALGLIAIFSLVSSWSQGNSFWLLWIWVVIMLVNDTLKSALYSNTFTSLLQPLQKKMKLIGLDMLGNVEAIAFGVSGLTLALFTWLDSATLSHFSYLLLFVLTGWIASITLLNKQYLYTLEKALKKRILEGGTLPLNDPQIFDMLNQKLNSLFPGEVLYALDLLCKGKSSKAPELLSKLLDHPSAEVRKEVLRRIVSLKLVVLQSQVKERIIQEQLPGIKKQAIQTYCFLGEANVVDEISLYLESEEELIQTGALVGLICYGGINGVILAGGQLNGYVHSPIPEKRAFAADVIGEVGIHHFYHPLLNLLEDEDVVVRKAALRASGKIKHPRLYGPMLRAVSSPQVFEVAVNALILTGEGAINMFEIEFSKPDFDPVRLRRLIYISGKVGGTKAINLLKNKLYFKNIEVRNQILHSLTLCKYTPNPAEKDEVLRTIQSELGDAAWFLNCIEVITLNSTAAEMPYYSLLINALHIELHHLKKRLILLLSYIYDSNDVLQVWESLQLKNKEKRANALEVLDVLVAKELSSVILPLLEDFPLSQQVKIMNARFPQKRLSVPEYLQKLINRQEVPVVNIWTQAISLYIVRKLLIDMMINEVVLAVSHPNKLVAETAFWALKGFYPDNYNSYLFNLASEELHILQTASHKTNTSSMNTHLLAIEKVMALKTTAIFRETSEDILVDIASILKEVTVKKDENIFEKNDIGTCMFIIYEGSVRIHDGEHTLAELKTRDFFGELSLLDTEPRSASVTALENSFLLRLDQHAFYEIMADRIEVTREIMKILCRRLRSQNKVVAQMKQQMAEPFLKASSSA